MVTPLRWAGCQRWARAPAKDPLSWLNRTGALAPLGLAEIALARIGPSAPIAVKDLAEFVERFCSNPNTPAGKGFACGSGRAFLFPSSTHRGNFQQVRPLNLRFWHRLELLRTIPQKLVVCLPRKKLQFPHSF